MRATPDNASVRLLTYKEGLLSRIGHDLHLAVTRFSIEVEDDQIRARFDTRSITVVAARQAGADAPGVLSDDDRRQIDRNTAEHVLATRRFPEIRYDGTADRVDDDTWEADGTLELVGVRRPLRLSLERDGDRWRGTVRLHQPDFGITPFSALLGTLRIMPHVDVLLDLPG